MANTTHHLFLPPQRFEGEGSRRKGATHCIRVVVGWLACEFFLTLSAEGEKKLGKEAMKGNKKRAPPQKRVGKKFWAKLAP